MGVRGRGVLGARGKGGEGGLERNDEGRNPFRLWEREEVNLVSTKINAELQPHHRFCKDMWLNFSGTAQHH